jgi:membrane-associated phospholipid phosphatase
MRHLLRAAALACLMLHSASLLAQPTAPRDSALPDSRLFQRSDLLVTGAFAAATIAMFPLDRQLAIAVRDSGLVSNPSLRRAASTIGFLGSPGPFIIGGTMYVIGRYANKPRLAHVAVHGTEAIFVGLAVAGAVKTTLGRARPYITADTNPGNFGFLRGFKSDAYQAFPSGHATTAFAVASAVTAESSEWWPGRTWLVGTVLYGGATLVGVSRMYEDKHWASDIIMGAAIGIFSGLKTVRFTHTRTGNRVDRWLLGERKSDVRLRVSPGRAGALLLGVDARW